MTKRRTAGGFLAAALVAGCLAATARAAVPILTYQYDNTRVGANTNETALAPANINTNTFGKLFTYPVDGYVYGQPLVATNVVIPGQGTHNVLYIVTEHDSVYAFDADNLVSTPYWRVSFIYPPYTNTIQTSQDIPRNNITPEIGITGTPVIDPVSQTIYIEARTREISTFDGRTNYLHRLHALDIATGAERPNSPVIVTTRNYPGTGGSSNIINGVVVPDTDGAGHVLWNPLQEQNRPGLLLVNGQVYISYAQPGDILPYHGWLFAYDAQSLAQTSVFCLTPNGNAGGIWAAGNGPAADANGNIFLNTGNGTFDVKNQNFGDSYLKFSQLSGSLQVLDYFTPFNQASLNSADLDVSASGLILLPDSVGSAGHPHLLIGGSKAGAMYLIDRDNMGHFNAANDNQIPQALRTAVTGQLFASPAYFNGTLYVVGNSDRLKSYAIANASIATPFLAQGSSSFSQGTTPTISANGTSNGVVWALNIDSFNSGGAAILRAYNATNVAQELYNSSQILSRDNPGPAVHFTLPSVANGHVYVPARFQVSVFGNAIFLATPVIAPNGGSFINSRQVTLSDATPGVSIYYTTDGSTPTTNSPVYSTPFTLTHSTLVKAMAAMPGAINSAVASASFINSAELGHGTGLTGSYWSNTDSVTFTNPAFANPPSFVRIDPTVNFNWNSSAPTNTMARTNFVVSWTGAIQPIYNDNYTISAFSDDGERMWINGQLVIDQWIARGITTNSVTLPLKAQQVYNIRLDYFQGTQNAQVGLTWSSASQASQTIPQTQLYPQTNPPPAVAITAPSGGATYTAPASISLDAVVATQTNSVSNVVFYANGTPLATLTNSPYVFTATGLAQGGYALTAVATDGSGLVSTSAPVSVTVTAGTGQPFGVATRGTVPAFFDMPAVIPPNLPGALPLTLSQTGVFADTPSMTPAGGLIPYSPNTPLWSDAALKTRWVAVPFDGTHNTPAQQISFSPTGEWLFPSGTVFVKHFGLTVDETNPNVPPRRLETRLLVRDTNGAVYGVTYKWRPDNTEADLLTTSLSEDITITNASGTRVQTWYYPSPSECLICHTPAASYVLGVKTRQLNGNYTYPGSAVTDNQLRTLNHLGLLNPAFNEANIATYAQLVSVTNQAADLTNRFRSYIDANCAQCHRPGGASEANFDARYDTPLANQGIINGLVIGNLGVNNAHVVTPQDLSRSVLYQRANSLDPNIKMPPLARNLVDTNAMAMVAAFINSLPITLLNSPIIIPNGGAFNASVNVSLAPPDATATMYYTLDGSQPTTNSVLYAGAFTVTNSPTTVTAYATEAGFTDSFPSSAVFNVYSDLLSGYVTNGIFTLPLSGAPNMTYILQGSTNLIDWVALSTNVPTGSPFLLTDPNAGSFPQRFYRALQLP